MEHLPIARSGAQLIVGVGAVFGFIGGAYLLQCGAQRLLGKITDKKNKKDADVEQICNVCCAELNASDPKNFVTCCTCKKLICRGQVKCGIWLPKDAQWECQLCHATKESLAQTSSWVAEQMSFNEHKFVYPMRARSEIYIPISDCPDSSMHFESVSQIGVNMAAISSVEKSKIREYVEELVASMLGGCLDQIKVGQLSKSETYLPAILNGQQTNNNNNNNNNNANNNNNNNSANNNSGSQNGDTEFVDLSQARLRQLIETIIAETLRSGASTLAASSGAISEITLDTRSLSNGEAGNNKRRHRTEHYFEPKIYQDLLATAVLNKISDKEGNTRLLSESTPDLSARNIDENYNVEGLSTTSGSSIEPGSDCSLTDHELMLNAGKLESQMSLEAALERESVLNDYIAAHMVPLPDMSASVTESDDDIGSMTSSMIGDGTWEDNWLFKKKRSALPSSTTSSSMLVPAPKEHVRAQIGDKTADEVSDLSEMGSDTDDSSLDLLRCNELNDRLLNKHLIGGQNTKIVLDEIVDRNSMTSNTVPAESEPLYTETANVLVKTTATKADATNGQSIASEKQGTTVENKALPPPPPMDFQDDSNGNIMNPIVGSIAERECKKWYNAVEMPNNPYAPEALKQRISGHQERCMDLPNISPSTEQNPLSLINENKNEIVAEPKRETDYKRYSRDYYINEAQLENAKCQSPVESAAKASTMEQSDATASANEDDIVINEAQKAKKTANQLPAKDATDATSTLNNIYKALPAQVVPDENTSSLETLSNQSQQSLQMTTSDDSDTVRVYNFNKQETTVLAKKSKSTETLETSSSMESALSTPPKEMPKKCERPKALQFSSTSEGSGSALGSPKTPTRGSTPPAFRFLQPKRKLIDPSQVLSIDEDEAPENSAPAEKKIIEHEVAHVMPSVKALAQAFLLTSKNTQSERRWPTKSRLRKSTAEDVCKKSPVALEPPIKQRLEPGISMCEAVDEATIASDLSSLETDPSMQLDTDPKESQNAPLATITSAKDMGNVSPVPVRAGFLRSNIAFFENLKFK